MNKDNSLKKILKQRNHCIATLDEYIKLVDMLGGEDDTVLRSMFLGFAAESIGADRVTFYFYDKKDTLLYPNVTMVYKKKRLVPYDYYSDLKNVSIRIGDDICGYAAKKKRPLLVKDVSLNEHYKGHVDKIVKMKAKSVIAIPMVVEDNVIGVIEVTHAAGNRTLTRTDFSAISVITRITLITMEKLKLYNWSVTDNLTQLYNYQYLQICMEKELTRAKRYPKDVGVILFDIDDFKTINDTYGHMSGNTVLKGVSKIMKDTLRQNIDMPVRYGGDEFLILLPETDIKGSKRLAERLLENVHKGTFIVENNTRINVTLSIGVTAAQKNNILDQAKLIENADKALYKAKKEGKDCVAVLI